MQCFLYYIVGEEGETNNSNSPTYIVSETELDDVLAEANADEIKRTQTMGTYSLNPKDFNGCM